MCREEAADLCASLAGAQLNVPVLAVVKEQELELTSGTDFSEMRGLTTFRDKYFCGPLYLADDDRALYEFLGNKNVFTLGSIGRTLRNPFKRRREFKEMQHRFAQKGIGGNRVGDGMKKGGVLCIAPNGKLIYTHKEQPGKGVPFDDLTQIIEAVRSFGTD